MVCHCNLSNNVAKCELFVCYKCWLESTNFFCTNDFICRAIWRHLSFLPYQCSILLIDNVEGWQSYPAISGTQLQKQCLALPSPLPKKMRRTPSFFLIEYTLGLDKLSKLHLIPNLAWEQALQLYVVWPEVSCKRMFSWGLSSYIPTMLSTRQQPPSL